MLYGCSVQFVFASNHSYSAFALCCWGLVKCLIKITVEVGRINNLWFSLHYDGLNTELANTKFLWLYLVLLLDQISTSGWFKDWYYLSIFLETPRLSKSIQVYNVLCILGRECNKRNIVKAELCAFVHKSLMQWCTRASIAFVLTVRSCEVQGLWCESGLNSRLILNRWGMERSRGLQK